MARQGKANKVSTITGVSTFRVIGILTSVYEGKNNNYLTIKVYREDINPKTKEPYYDNIKVTASPDIELFDDNTTIEVTGTVRQYFDTQTVRSIMVLVADSVKAVSNG